MTELCSSLYFGRVIHERVRPVKHRLDYRVFSTLIDLDELPALARRLRLFSHNRFNVFGFFDRDYGPSDGSPLRPWVERHLFEAGIDLRGGPVRLLCFPRIFGYVFNPLSVYFCYRPGGDLAAVLYEVSNTFGQRHTYLIPVSGGGSEVIRQQCQKRFYVSPFNAVEGHYRFNVKPPADTLAIAINQCDDAGLLLHASHRARRVPLTDRALVSAFLRYPLMTLKVMGGIHWEALRLWRKGLRLVDRPPPPARPVTVVASPEA
jgi:DUF1365 family protein